MAKVTIGTCGKCRGELKVKEAAAKPLMRLTCKCGWYGYVGYGNCSICGKKVLAIDGRFPSIPCPDTCAEESIQKHRQPFEHPHYVQNDNKNQSFVSGALPSHWQQPHDSGKFWDNEKVPVLTSTISHPYATSLDVAPDQEHLVCLAPSNLQDLEIVVYSTKTFSETHRLPYSAPMRWPSSLRPSVLFVGSDRILVVNELKSYVKDGADEVRLTLYDVVKGSKLAEVDVPDCNFEMVTVRHDTKTIIARKKSFQLLICEAANDNLTCNTIKTDQIMMPGPCFGPDGKLYVMLMDGLYCFELESEKRLMDGNHCVSFHPFGQVCCGGGSGDFSGASALRVADLNTGATREIPWGLVPIDQIEISNDQDIIVSNRAAEQFQVTGRFAFISLFSMAENATKWVVKLDSLQPWRNPLLLSAAEDNWALISTGLTIRRIFLPGGKSFQMIPMQQNEYIEAKWLPAKRLLCLARNPDEYLPGKLEWYGIE